MQPIEESRILRRFDVQARVRALLLVPAMLVEASAWTVALLTAIVWPAVSRRIRVLVGRMPAWAWYLPPVEPPQPEAAKWIASATAAFLTPDDLDLALKAKVVAVLRQTVDRPELRSGWLNSTGKSAHGISFGAAGSVPRIHIWKQGDCFVVLLELMSEESLAPGDWDNHASARVHFTAEELEPFFEAFSAAGLPATIQTRRLVAEATNLRRIDEAITAFLGTDQTPETP